jgi:predicted PurR-regulated permease PerM
MSLPSPSPRQARLIWLAITGLALATLVGLVVLLFWGLGHVINVLGPVLWPLAIAGIIACLLDPAVDGLQRKGASRPRAILAVFAMALVLVTALFGSVVPQLITETRRFAERVPDYTSRLGNRVELWISHPPQWLQKILKDQTTTSVTPHPEETNGVSTASVTNTPTSPSAWNEGKNLLGANIDQGTIGSAANWLAKRAQKVGSWVFGRVASGFGILAGLALIPVYAFYFLLEKRGITSRWTDYLPMTDSVFKNELVFIIHSVNNYLIAFFRGQVLVAITDGILYGIGFLIIGLDYALLIGAAAIVLTIVPFLGAIIIFITSLVVALVQFGDWLHPLLVVAVFAVVQTLESLVISPKIMGDRVGLHPLTIIIAVMVGTTLLGGLLGGILAIPLTAALRVLMFRYIWKRPTQTAASS